MYSLPSKIRSHTKHIPFKVPNLIISLGKYSKNRAIILRFNYNAPTPSSYQWTIEGYQNLMTEVAKFKLASHNDNCEPKITSDTNFEQITCEELLR